MRCSQRDSFPECWGSDSAPRKVAVGPSGTATSLALARGIAVGGIAPILGASLYPGP